MTRRKFSEADVIATLTAQGYPIACHRCDEMFFVETTDGELIQVLKVEREHLHEIALGGADEPRNCRYSCTHCHALVTNGKPATSAGSSKNRIAKTKGTRADKFVPVKKPLDEPREKRPAFGRRR